MTFDVNVDAIPNNEAILLENRNMEIAWKSSIGNYYDLARFAQAP
jgi:hypothetical protein